MCCNHSELLKEPWLHCPPTNETSLGLKPNPHPNQGFSKMCLIWSYVFFQAHRSCLKKLTLNKSIPICYVMQGELVFSTISSSILRFWLNYSDRLNGPVGNCPSLQLILLLLYIWNMQQYFISPAANGWTGMLVIVMRKFAYGIHKIG